MADLTGSTIASTYKDLLQVSNSNSGIDSTLRVIEDGEGTESILSLSSSAAKISSSSQLQFRDSAIHISSDADGYLNVQADTGVNINIGGTDELAVTATTSTFGTNLVIPDSGTIGNASDTDLLTFTSGVLTVAGELDATTLDISGNADIDGTLEADAITVDGVALATFIRDTVGTNMLSSNTESGITVTYDTSNDNIDFSIDAAQTTITSLLATDIKIGEDDQTKIDFETADEIHFYAANVEQVYLGDNIFGPQSDSDVDLGSTSVRWKDAFVDSITVTGEVDGASLDISGDADIDGTLEADAITVNGTALSSVIAGTTVTLASTVTVTDSTANTNFPVVFHNESNALLDDTGALRYNPSTGTLLVPNLSVAGTTTTVDTVTMEASNAIIFEGATADGNETTLSIIDPTGDRTINLPNQSGTLPVLAAASTTQISSTPEELNILDGATVVVGEINALDLGSTAVGNAIASKAVILDSNKDYTGIRNFTITGELDAGSLDISGDVDVDGTLEADAVTIDGTALTEFVQDIAGGMFSGNTETGITATYQDGDNNIDLAINASQTTITSLLATDIKIGEDDQTKIDFETADEIHFYAANVEQVYLGDNIFGPQSDSDVDLGSSSVRWKDAYIDTITTTGNVTVAGTLSLSDGDITNVGDIALDTISSDAGTSIGVTLGTDAGDDFNVGSGKLVVEGDTSQTGVNTATPTEKLTVNGGIIATNSANRSAGEGIVMDYVTGSDLGRITVGDWGTAYEELQIEAEKYTLDVGGSGNIMAHHVTNNGSALFNTDDGIGSIGANVVSVADDSTIALTDNDGSIAHVYIYERGSGSAGIFTVGFGPASAVVVSSGHTFSTSDTDGAICLISGTSSHTITFKNRIGSTGNFRIMMVGAGSPAPI
tara:strand:+ start:1077 stop:3761 length:2685 start_codon:yes stop_codon:yes gene_type:complete